LDRLEAVNVSSSGSSISLVEVLDVELDGIVKAKDVDLIRFSYLAFIS
jgi:hypothetical protein